MTWKTTPTTMNGVLLALVTLALTAYAAAGIGAETGGSNGADREPNFRSLRSRGDIKFLPAPLQPHSYLPLTAFSEADEASQLFGYYLLDTTRVKTIDVIASQFEFEPSTISVVEGDTVRLRIRSADRTHGIGIKAFRVKSLIPRAGETITVEFVAGRVGRFDITCSEYCGTGHREMKGKLVVLAREK